MRTLSLCILLLLAGCAETNNSPDIGYARGRRLSNGMVVETDADHEALPLTTPDPEYPAVAKSNGVHGKVRAEMKIDEEGRVSGITILQSADQILASAAVDTLKTWTFIPAVKQHHIVATTRIVEFAF